MTMLGGKLQVRRRRRLTRRLRELCPSIAAARRVAIARELAADSVGGLTDTELRTYARLRDAILTAKVNEFDKRGSAVPAVA